MLNNESINQLIKKFDYGRDYPSKITKAANNYIRSVKSYGWDDKEFINGYQTIKWVQVTVKQNGYTETVWSFKTAQQPNGKTGYLVNSWKDHFDIQVSKEDGNTAYLMIMQKARETKGTEIIVETII
jgi:hypothetical protein